MLSVSSLATDHLHTNLEVCSVPVPPLRSDFSSLASRLSNPPLQPPKFSSRTLDMTKDGDDFDNDADDAGTDRLDRAGRYIMQIHPAELTSV